MTLRRMNGQVTDDARAGLTAAVRSAGRVNQSSAGERNRPLLVRQQDNVASQANGILAWLAALGSPAFAVGAQNHANNSLG